MSIQSSPKNNSLNLPVFFSATGVILLFLFVASAYSQSFGQILTILQDTIIEKFGWFYLLSVAVILGLMLALAFSNYGNIKLGPDHAETEFSYPAWFAMLFSAGMGIGIVFFAVAEPVTHYVLPPVGTAQTVEAAQQAMSITFFHWGIHAWAIYAAIGLSLAYFGFRHNLPMSLRSALFPLIGQRIYGSIGNLIDIFAIIATVFGLATSLGLGVMQINSGVNYLFGTQTSNFMLLSLIAVITLLSTFSVALGLDKGLKRLSVFNLVLALLLIVFVFAAGPTLKLLPYFVENIGNYLSTIVRETFTLYAYRSSDWIADWSTKWTLFYWAWWIAWSPFVGMFIARISRGRTIREFLVGVLFVPALFTFAWMTIFGNTAIELEMAGFSELSETVIQNVPAALFKFFELLPFSQITSYFAILLIIIFFVTSMDSGALVVAMISSGGEIKTKIWSRIFWAVAMGATASVLLLLGGLQALQTAVIISAFPFVFVVLLVCYGLIRGLRIEALRQRVSAAPTQVTVARSRASWEKRLRSIITYPKKEVIQKFIAGNVDPAMSQVCQEFEKQNMHAVTQTTDNSVTLEVSHGDEINFIYKVLVKAYATPSFMLLDFSDDEDIQKKYYRAEVHLLEGNQFYDIMGYNIEEIIEDILSQYDKHMQFLHLSDQ